MSTANKKPSRTYKLRTPYQESAIYFTVVGTPIDAMFINCKEMESFQWISALMASYSLLVKNGVAPEKIAGYMCEVFDPNGQYVIEGTTTKVNGVVHHLGLILRQHVRDARA